MAPGFIASFDDFILFQQVKFAYKNFADESKSILLERYLLFYSF